MAGIYDEDWQAVLAFLPDQWEDMAFETGALRRIRAFKNPEALLRTLMIHLAQGCSLRETVVRAKRGGIARVSDVALLKRLRASEGWLKYLAKNLGPPYPIGNVLEGLKSKYRICAVDATTISEPGSTGTDWRLHYMLELPTLTCEHFELTDCHGGETLKRFPVQPGDLILADRGYENATGINHVHKSGGRVIVRIRVSQCPLRQPETMERLDVLALARTLKSEYTCDEWPAALKSQTGQTIIGRLCLLRKSEAAIQASEKNLAQIASRKGKKVSARALEAARYVGIFATVDSCVLTVENIFEIYRYRWQIELAFKRLKTLTGFGHLPKSDQASCRAWIYGKLFIGLLAERMSQAPFFP